MRRTSRALVLAAATALSVVGCTVTATSDGGSSPGSTGSAGAGGSGTAGDVTSTVDQGVVDIVSTLGLGNGQAAGTGIVLTSSGEVVTNNHVISGATSISATDVGNGRTYQATVVGYSRSQDLAVLQLTGASGLHTLTLAASARPVVGASVTAIGNAGGVGGTPSAVSGTIIALDQTITATDAASGSSESLSGLIAVNANVQPGDSGGPLVDVNGDVVGIDTAATVGYQFQDSGQGGQSSPQGYAIPAAQAGPIAAAIAAHQASATTHIGTTAFLGVSVSTGVTIDGTPGAQVVGLLAGGPALSLGLGPGDVITAMQGQTVHSATALTQQLDRHHPGDQVTLAWTDTGGAQHSATLRLASGPAG